MNYLGLLGAFWIFGMAATTSLLQSQVNTSSQTRRLAVGITAGIGTQNAWPFNQWTYQYDVRYIKGQLNYRLADGSFQVEFLVQPGISVSTHRLIDTLAIEEHLFGPEFLTIMHEYGQEKRMREFMLNVGVVVRKRITEHFSVHLLGSVGPACIDTATDRLPKGFTFTDVLAVGVSYHTSGVKVELRVGVRHLSNAGLRSPNGGYNATFIETGVLFPLGK